MDIKVGFINKQNLGTSSATTATTTSALERRIQKPTSKTATLGRRVVIVVR